MIKVIQIGFGPLGVQTAKFIAKKSTINLINFPRKQDGLKTLSDDV
ncbi:MAG: hypothetical protein HON33_02700, partial [Flavobacteriaceae bacterium]|nr:hypothetical protein [Flavobacteriaceae bacterium]